MVLTQVSPAKKAVTAAFAGVVALSLMVPSQLAFADYYIGDDETPYASDKDADGEGSDGGTWSYKADGQEMTLADYVGGAIRAYEQDLNIQLEGENSVESIYLSGGDLTITGDENAYGEAKPSLELAGYKAEGDEVSSNGYISVQEGDLTISDVNITAEAEYAGISAYNGDLTITDSKVARGDDNESMNISASAYDAEKQETADADVTFKGSVIEATGVYASGELTIDNTDLTVEPNEYSKEAMEQDEDYKWIEYAVTALKGINLIGEQNGEIEKHTDEYGNEWYYLTTGDDDKIELKASQAPAYYGSTQGMPQTSDSNAPMTAGLGITAAFAALVAAFAMRQSRKEF